MNEKKGSPIAAIKGIFGSSKILFICIVYTISVIGNIAQKFEDRIDFEGMSIFGFSLSELLGAELVGMLQTVANALFVISLISLLPMVLITVGYWLIRKGAGEGNGNTRCALIALDFFKYNLLYQACMKAILMFLVGVLGIFGAYLGFSSGSAGIGLLVIIAAAVVIGVLVLMFKYYTGFISMLLGVSNTLRTGINLVTRSKIVFVFNVLSAVWMVLTALGGGFFSIVAAVAGALCLIFINRCFMDFEQTYGYADADETTAVVKRIRTEPALAKTADALGIVQVTPEEDAAGVKKPMSFMGIVKLFFGLSIAPIDEAELSEEVVCTDVNDTDRYTPSKQKQTFHTPGALKEIGSKVLPLFDSDISVIDARYEALGSTELDKAIGCPVTIGCAAVLKDSVSEKKILRLKLENTSVCAVKKIIVEITTENNDAGSRHIIKNVALSFESAIVSGGVFGASFGTVLPDDATCGSVKITCVEFDDGLCWDKNSAAVQFFTDEKRKYDEEVQKRLEEQKRIDEERRRNAENNGDHSDVPVVDESATEEKNSIAPLVLAILSAVSLVLGIFVPYFIFHNFGSGFISAADLNVVSLVSLIISVSPFVFAFSSLLTRKKSAKYGKAASIISIVVIALTLIQRLLGGVANLLVTLLVVCLIFGIIALVKKDKPLYLPLLLITAAIGVFLASMFLFDFGASNKEPASGDSGGTLSGNAGDVVEFELQYQSNGDGTCYFLGDKSGASLPSYFEVPQYSPDGELVTGIGDRAFEFQTSITEIVLPESVTYIGLNAFEGCTSLRSVSMPGVTSIAHYAFVDCRELETVTNTNNLVSIGDHAFAYCTYLSSFEYAPQLRGIGSSAFLDSGLSEFIMSDTVTSIGQNAFAECEALSSLRLSRNLSRIPYGAFFDCSSLETVEIPGSVTNIEMSAFSSCSSLIEVVMYPGVICIEETAFSDCYALEYVHFPSSIELIEDGAFYCCSGISRISYGGTEDMWQRFIWEQVDENSWTGINDALQWASMEYQNGDERQDDGGPICEEAATTDIPAEYEGN